MPDWTPSGDAADFPGCWLCRHLSPTVDAMACKAYPDGIPLRIFGGDVDHLVERPGQAGRTLFEAKSPA